LELVLKIFRTKALTALTKVAAKINQITYLFNHVLKRSTPFEKTISAPMAVSRKMMGNCRV
jgi:hypothetical protein